MKTIKTILLFAACASRLLAQEDLTRHVDPYIGCSYNGHCFAAACVPFGLVQAGPDTGFLWWDYCSGYRYADTKILGFSQTHLSGTGCGDLGDLMLMPFTGAVDLTRTNFASAYRKETQTARPGFYEVTLDDSRARVSIAAAKHAAIYEIGYRGTGAPQLFVDLQYGILNWSMKTPDGRVLACDVRQEDDRTLVGTLTTKVWVERTYSFVLTFDRAIAARRELPKRAVTEKAPRYVLSFDLPAGGTLKAKVALSATDVAAAKRNLVAEIPHWDVALVRCAARAKWNAVLSRMTAEGSPEQLKTFYTSLYHLFIQPNDIADVGERPFYSTFSYWDTFRAAHPLYTIVAPERVDGFVDSTLRQAEKQGYMPIWTLWGKDNHCMIGSHSVPVVVDAYLKGFRSFDAEKAYALIRKSLTENVPGRAFNQADTWAKYGYFPFDVVKCESVSRTLEHAYDDWCAARFAEVLGKREDAAFFAARANNWTNVFDRSVGFARGRDSKGNWREPFNPFKLNVGDRGEGPKDFTEGNSWQYTWHVMQDPEGLMAAMGGRDRFLKNLDGLFSQPEQVEGMGFALDATGLVGQYAHGNEPSHHTAYLFTLAGRSDRTADVVREVCDRFYRPEPEGLCGNDDCGQMSAWYLFSAMGFYPVNPCGGEYVIGAPQLPKVEVKVRGEGGQWKKFSVIAKGLSKENKYVKSVTLNGRPLDGNVLRHADIMNGGELVFKMSADALVPPAPGAVRLEGRAGLSADRCLNARVYSDWARGDMYEECVNSFRTHWDDSNGHVGWQNEYWGKTMLCFAGAIAYTGDAALADWVKAKTHAFLAEFQKPNGYLSTYGREDFLRGNPDNPDPKTHSCFNVWGRKYTLWALIEIYRTTGDRAALDGAVKVADHLIAQLKRLGTSLDRTGYWHGISSMSILRPILELHQIVPKPEYRALADEIVAAMGNPKCGPGALIHDAFRKEKICEWHPEPLYWAKAYEIMSCLEGLVQYYRLTGDRHVLDAVFAFYGHIEREELNAMRSVGFLDHFVDAARHVNAMTELCDVIHWIRLNRELLLLTGEAKYADRIEEAFYNAFLAGVWRDGRWGAHVVRSHGTRHVNAPAQTGMHEHQCCPDNMMRTYFDVAGSVAARDADGNLAVLLYSDAVARLPGAEVRISGGYPWGETAVRVEIDRTEAGKVRFRVPDWSKVLVLNGRTVKAEKGWCETSAPAGKSFWTLAFDLRPRLVDLGVPREFPAPAPAVRSFTDIMSYTTYFWEWMTPETRGLTRVEPGLQVFRGPLVLAKGRLAGTSRQETLFATSLNFQGWQAKLSPRPTKAADAGVPQAWDMTLFRGIESKTVPVSDFASVSNMDDPENWFSLWF